MIAISGFLSALECPKSVPARGYPTGEAYSTHPDPLADLRRNLLLRKGEESRNTAYIDSCGAYALQLTITLNLYSNHNLTLNLALP